MASDIERAAFSRGVRSRDAEIAALKAELEAERFDTRILRRNLDQARDDHDAEAARLRAALAAGPAALRAVALQARAAGETLLADGALDCAAMVEAAQAAAMKDDDKKGGG